MLRAIINPAMIVTWATGLWLAWRGFQFMGGWLHVKIAMVVILSAAHGYFSASVRRFAEDWNDETGAALADHERGSDSPDDHHRHHGDCEAVLSALNAPEKLMRGSQNPACACPL